MKKILISIVAIAVVILASLTITKEISKREITSLPEGVVTTALFGWGDNSASQIVSDKDGKQNIISAPISIAANAPLKIYAAESSTGYLSQQGETFGWGGNDVHQINDSEEYVVLDQQKITTPASTVDIKSTSRHSLALTDGGDVYAWGYNYTGQLGNGTNRGERTPVKVKGLPKIESVAAGYKFSLALAIDGKVYGWGGLCATASERAIVDFASTLASGSSYYEPILSPSLVTSANEDCVNESVVGILSKSPKLFSGVENVSAISAGYGHGLFLKKDGTVWSFGCNLYGQLGNRGTINSPSNAIPMQVEGLVGITSISAGFRHSLALTDDGRVYMWGGKIVKGKNGPEAEKNKDFVLVSGLPPIEKIVAGRDYSLALTKDGKLYGWGSNMHHELSPKSTEVYASPIEIELPGKVIDVAAGQTFVLATIAAQ